MNKNSFLVKVIVALCGSTAFILLFNFLPVWVTAAMSTLVSVMIFYEFSVNGKLIVITSLRVIGFIVSASLPWMIYFNLAPVWIFLLIFLSAFAAFISLIAAGINGKSGEIVNLIFCESLFQISISLMAPFLKINHGVSYVILAFISAWGTDAIAQLAGKAFGKTKLIPSVSPNKTVGGFVSGLSGNALITVIFVLVLNHNHPEIPAAGCIICGIICGFIGSVGDLFFSYFKRTIGIKDFGKLIAGHGGVLDRFDSVIFVLPVWYAFVTSFCK